MNIKEMNENYGGKQRSMQATLIKEEEGYLGSNSNRMSQPVDIQHFDFREDDEGPFYLSETERAVRKYDTPTGKTTERKHLKAELLEMLNNNGHTMTPDTNVKHVSQTCVTLGIPLKAPPTPVICEGWCGKPMGHYNVVLSMDLWMI